MTKILVDREVLEQVLEALYMRPSEQYVANAIDTLRTTLDAPSEPPCPYKDEPRGCYRVRCQLGKQCVGEAL
jgi:hypothetical protein